MAHVTSTQSQFDSTEIVFFCEIDPIFVVFAVNWEELHIVVKLVPNCERHSGAFTVHLKDFQVFVKLNPALMKYMPPSTLYYLFWICRSVSELDPAAV